MRKTICGSLGAGVRTQQKSFEKIRKKFSIFLEVI